MISVLIPTYNYDCTRLVTDLHTQLEVAQVPYEIVVADDCSTIQCDFSAIEMLSNCRLIRQQTNFGRAKIRNFLADEAKFDYLLFLDGDALVSNSAFVENYLQCIRQNAEIVVGGTAYDPENHDSQYSLRLKYGRQREGRATYKGQFTTFNFLIKKSVFKAVRFRENIKGYGNEDTLFGIDLQLAGYTIKNIDNPLIHCGLDNNELFIEKTENACRNLLKLHVANPTLHLENYSKVVCYYDKLCRWHAVSLVSVLFSLTKVMLHKQLCSQNPSLFLFDCYKLGSFCQMAQKEV